MSRVINVILPVSSDDDTVSITDVDDISTLVQSPSPKKNSSDSIEQDNFNLGGANGDADLRSLVKHFSTNTKVCRTSRDSRQIHNNRRQQLPGNPKQYRESQQGVRSVSEQEQNKSSLSHSRQQKSKLPLSQRQHAMSGDVTTQGHVIILDKNDISSSPATVKVERQKSRQHNIGIVRNVRLSATEAYDIDAEHRDMMMKALRFYTQYCRHGGSNHCIECNGSYPLRKERLGVIPDVNNLCGSSYNNEKTLPCGSSRIARCVKMAQCRLRFYDDVDKIACEDKSDRPKTPSFPYSKPLLYVLEDGDGVLADASGHTYRSKQTHPWSGLPRSLCDVCDGSYQKLCPNCSRRFQKTASVTRDGINNRKLQRSDLNSSSELKVVSLSLTDSMSQSIPRSVAYQRRNQTTHLWTDSSNLMSQSVPTASFLHRHFSSASSSPRSSHDDSAKVSKARPSSSYSYDGGFFVGAHSGQAEYFVIHPDWVSEGMTVKKISLGDKKPSSSLHRSFSLTSRTLPEGRRCLSAPPKQRNPITMDHAQRESKIQK